MKIHVFRPDLLGARLLNLAYGSALSDLMDVPFELHWPTFHRFADQSGYERENDLRDLFDEAHLPASAAFANGSADTTPFKESAAWGADLIQIAKAAARDRKPLHVDDLRAKGENFIFSHISGLPIDGIDQKQWAARAREKLHSLPARPELAAAEAELVGQLPRGKVIAIHIRRGDVVRDVMQQTEDSIRSGAHVKAISNFLMRFVPFEAYRDYLRTNRFEAALIFADEKQLFDLSGLSAILPAIDVTALVQDLPLTKIQKDFLEVKLMARADEILASQSRFALLASAFSGRSIIDLSRRGTVEMFMDDLSQNYGLTAAHPVHPELGTALRNGLVEC